ncbi:hypothetical protein ACIBAG_42965 [Streptomyces sp. NPDC051243]|uniref:hypothetical protein n=1 Tax=Streptomyces sp. NPDC051243 TaxID=3365646 RepID=UPI0037B18D25
MSAEPDRPLEPEVMTGWASLTTRHFSQLKVPGGHMYLLTEPAPLLDLVKELELR